MPIDLKTILLYWHTIRHLKAVQFYGRLIHRIWRPLVKTSSSPKISQYIGSWQKPATRLASMTGPQSFIFLNEYGNLDELGWDGTEKEKLWRYNQHYFDDLNGHCADDRKSWHQDLIDRWVLDNPPFVGTGWESYPTSLRIVNWIKWHMSGNPLSTSALKSLFMQLRWISKRLEYHLLGNHLLSNAKALVYGGLFFENTEAKNWLNKGLKILDREVKEQILTDGGHFELSTMYQSIALEDLLDLINITRCFSNRLNNEQNNQVLTWHGITKKMHYWLDTMCHPDGEISFFNDSAFHVAPSKSELDKYAYRVLSIKPNKKNSFVHHADSGYIKIEKNESNAFLDISRVGPNYIPGHAHADTLTFEWSVGKQRVIVNSGTSCYGNSQERLRQRGTAAHNTVVIDGKDSSEVWGGFRVAKRANPIELQILKNDQNGITEIQCSHDGYFRLSGKPKHNRRWCMDEECFSIEDNVSEKTKRAEARFHFHPDVQVLQKENKKQGTIQLPNRKYIEWEINEGQGRLEASTWHPRFGVSISNICLVVKLTRGQSKINFRYSN